MRTKMAARKSLGLMPVRLPPPLAHADSDEDQNDLAEYDARLVAVSKTLEEVERPGDCFTSGSFTHFPLPGLVIEGLGEVRFPLGEDGAKAIMTKSHLAPYGHGEATIVDTAVRNTWELHASQFRLQNTKWRDQIDAILAAIRTPLGINEATEFDAKLYKMLLYEEGGKFHTHQDSEKEIGMFGTLVVMLPCQFEGGELVVHHPSQMNTDVEPRVWNPAAMSVYDLKYAAFYGDCNHEVKPVTSGYRLCLTYNLVTLSSTHVPRFAGNHVLYQRLEASLQAFFLETEEDRQAKHQRVSLYGAAAPRPARPRTDSPQRDCQLVYVLEHKYTNPGLSFSYLKNKDLAVAQSLAKFCDDTHGAFSLYLCKIKYTLEYDPDCDEPEYHEKVVQLKSPWIKYGEMTAAPCTSMTANLTAEIAPVRFFEEVPFDGTVDHGFTGNAGSRMEKWYTSAALVVQPLKIELKQTALAGMDYAVNKWVKLVDSESPHARSFAATVFANERSWTTQDACFLTSLKAVRRLNSVEVLGDVLHSLSNIAFQEAIATTVDHFGWDQCRDHMFELAETARLRNRVNLVCSSLASTNDVDRISEVLTRVDLKPVFANPEPRGRYYGYGEPPAPVNPTGQEYARVLALAHRVSPEKLREYVQSGEVKALIQVIAPALAHFANSFAAGERPSEVTEAVHSVISDLHARMPRASSWDMSDIRLHGGRSCCQNCTQLQMFLTSRTQQTLRMPMKKADRHHIHKVIEAYAGSRLSHQTDRPITLVITKQLPAVDLHDKAREALQQLQAIVGTGQTSAQAPSRGFSIADIIEIDSD